jgi:transposase-like protein
MSDVICKLCWSTDTKKYGFINGEQRYYCHACKRKFKNDDSLFGGRVSAGDISSALLEYYSGLSINDIRHRILQEKGYQPAQSSVYQWVDKYTDKAVKYFDQFQPKVGDTWVADETVVKLDNHTNIWLWDIIDTKTRFLLASKISYRREMADAKILFALAYKRAGKKPKEILTDGLNLYPEAVESVYGEDVHYRSNPFVKNGDGEATRPIERWHETLKERTKVLYALKDTESALAFLDGFIAYYNFIRKHDGLENKTPAEVAGVNYDVKSWADVTHLGETKPVEIKPQYEIPPHVEMARLTMSGTPYHPGPHYGSKKGVNKAQILSEEKRKLRAKLGTKKLNSIARKKATDEAKTQAMMSITRNTRYDRNEQGLTQRQIRERGL